MQAVKQSKAMIIVLLLLFLISSCNMQPVPLIAGKDNCDFCKMTVADLRFGGEFITNKGKIYKFDDVHCLLSYIKSGQITKSEIKNIYLADFSGLHEMIPVSESLLVNDESLHSPMSGNIAAFSNKDSMEKIKTQLNAETITWDKLYE